LSIAVAVFRSGRIEAACRPSTLKCRMTRLRAWIASLGVFIKAHAKRQFTTRSDSSIDRRRLATCGVSRCGISGFPFRPPGVCCGLFLGCLGSRDDSRKLRPQCGTNGRAPAMASHACRTRPGLRADVPTRDRSRAPGKPIGFTARSATLTNQFPLDIKPEDAFVSSRRAPESGPGSDR